MENFTRGDTQGKALQPFFLFFKDAIINEKTKMLNAGMFILSFCFVIGEGYVASKRQYQIQNGPCSYTFLLPEQETCPPGSFSNQVQKDDPAEYEESLQRLEHLENIMENNTQWLLKVQVHLSLNTFLRCFSSYMMMRKKNVHINPPI